MSSATANVALAALTTSLPALQSQATSLTAQVVPPPGDDGRLPTLDGRSHVVDDVEELARAINAQAVAPRIDFDHHSEPGSRAHTGSTEAQGWVRNARVDGEGGLTADLEFNAAARQKVTDGAYRYLSPALALGDDGESVVGLSSVALVNNPNLPLRVSPNARRPRRTLAEREAELTRREGELALQEQQAAARAVEAAVAAGRIAPAQREYHLSAIATHQAGPVAGLRAFEAYLSGGGDQGGSPLTRRTGPRGTPARRPAGVPAFRQPADALPPTEERLALHAQIARHAQERNISYRDAVVELAIRPGEENA